MRPTMLFAPAELNPYYWWWLKSLRAWSYRWSQSMECAYLQWVGEMEMLRHEGGLRAYGKYRKYREKFMI